MMEIANSDARQPDEIKSAKDIALEENIRKRLAWAMEESVNRQIAKMYGVAK